MHEKHEKKAAVDLFLSNLPADEVKVEGQRQSRSRPNAGPGPVSDDEGY